MQLEQFCAERIPTINGHETFPPSMRLHGYRRICISAKFHRINCGIESNTWQRRRSAEGPSHFLREIAWREFSYHLMYHFPQLPEANFNPKFDGFEWLE